MSENVENLLQQILLELENLRQRVEALEQENANQQAEILALFQRFPPPQGYADYKTINDLTPITGGSISDDYKFAFASATQDYSLTLLELKNNAQADYDGRYAALAGSGSQSFAVGDPTADNEATGRAYSDNRYARRTAETTITAQWTYSVSPIVPNALAMNEAVNLDQLTSAISDSDTIISMFITRRTTNGVCEVDGLPEGWVVQRVAVGEYVVTHNLGFEPVWTGTAINPNGDRALGVCSESRSDSTVNNFTYITGSIADSGGIVDCNVKMMIETKSIL